MSEYFSATPNDRKSKYNEARRLKRLQSRTGGTGLRFQSNFHNEPVNVNRRSCNTSVKRAQSLTVTAAPQETTSPNTVKNRGKNLRNETVVQHQSKSQQQVLEQAINLSDCVSMERISMMNDIMNSIEREADLENIQQQQEEESLPRNVSTSNSWKKRMEGLNDSWLLWRQKILKTVVAFEGFESSTCRCCKQTKLDILIQCSNCKLHLCWECDYSYHFKEPFHARFLYERKKLKSCQLKPTQFVDFQGYLIEQEVPVPCFSQRNLCGNCSDSAGLFQFKGGKNSVVVITLNGRFDLNSTCFMCEKCSMMEEGTTEDYVRSGWWPAKPTDPNYFFCKELLEMWFQVKHNTPGTSLNKFLDSLSELSTKNQRSPVIDRTLFDKVADEYDYIEHRITTEFLQQPTSECWGCGDEPLALHADADFKDYRLKSAKGCDEEPLFGEVIIASNKTVADFVASVNHVKPPSKAREHCGGAEYKAAKTASSSFKGLDETALLVMSCRHGVIFKAANLHQGETYRHVLFMQKEANNKNTKFFCYDVVCQYWKFLKDVTKKMDEFKPLMANMKPFLSRWHGQTHAWYCQILSMGSWMEGAAATTGEMQEQVNSKLSQYGSTTKHMSKAKRINHFSSGAIKWNKKKNRNMAKYIAKQYLTVLL